MWCVARVTCPVIIIIAIIIIVIAINELYLYTLSCEETMFKGVYKIQNSLS